MNKYEKRAYLLNIGEVVELLTNAKRILLFDEGKEEKNSKVINFAIDNIYDAIEALGRVE